MWSPVTPNQTSFSARSQTKISSKSKILHGRPCCCSVYLQAGYGKRGRESQLKADSYKLVMGREEGRANWRRTLTSWLWEERKGEPTGGGLSQAGYGKRGRESKLEADSYTTKHSLRLCSPPVFWVLHHMLQILRVSKRLRWL